MDKYKKKSLNFMGFSRDLRKIERDNQRCASRLKRFSIIRPLDDESITEEKKESDTNIPAIGKTEAGARVELLQKWKQEKMMKKQQESKLKKPAFKVGITKTTPSPSVSNKPLFALDTSRLLKPSFQVSNYQSFVKKRDVTTYNSKTNAKVSNFQASAKKPDITMGNLKTSAKDIKIPPSKSKIGVNSKLESKWTKNKESNIQSLSIKPKVDSSSKVVNKDQLYGNRKQPIMTSKPPETKKVSQLQPLNTRSKVISTARSVKSNIPSSGLPKLTTSNTLNKATAQIHVPKSIVPKIPEGNSKIKQIPVKSTVKSMPKFSKTVTSQQKSNISKPTSTSKSKVPNKSNENFSTFECELSHIEPVEEQRKSFAPKGFQFQPPAELSSSLFLEDGPSAIFLRMRNQFLRTSTPKQNSLDQKSSPKIEDTKSLEFEDKECLNNENNICSQNINKEFKTENKYDFETHLSSSFGLVNLNDVKSMDCKKSLKFEYPEVVSIENQEEMPLSSKNIQPKHSLVTDVSPTEAIYPTVLNDSVERVKTEIISTDIIPTETISSSILPACVGIAKTEIKSSDTSPYRSINPLSDLVENRKIESPTASESAEIEKTEINSSDVSSTLTINPPILPDLVEKDNTEIIFTGTTNADGNLVTELSDNDSVFLKEIPSENAEKSQVVFNGFLQKQENSFAKRTRNFRPSGKPGLLSISESVENTPKSTLKKNVLGNDLTPRRSLRLAKLSGNFNSMDNLLDCLKPKGQGEKGDFTPRRSARLSKFSTEFNSAENLFDIKRPTLYGTPEGESVSKLYSKITYDFDRLSSEMEEETFSGATGFGKVSLLPMSRPSIIRHSIRGDLMSFSPDSKF